MQKKSSTDQNKFFVNNNKALTAAAVAIAAIAFSGCTTTLPRDQATRSEQHADINAKADSTLTRLYEAAPNSESLVSKAKGVLVFPKVLSASFVVGAEHGNGVLRVNGQNQGYYSTSSGSFGLQAGAQSKAIVLLFMTQEALDKFRNSSGWTAGVDATVAVANLGANGSIDTNTAKEPVVGFVMTNAGLVAGVSLQGTKITKVDEKPVQ